MLSFPNRLSLTGLEFPNLAQPDLNSAGSPE